MLPRKRKTTNRRTNVTTTRKPTIFTRSRVNRTGKDYWSHEFKQRIEFLKRWKLQFPGNDKKFFDDEIEKIGKWKQVVENSTKSKVLASAEDLNQKFNEEKKEYEKKIKR
ncbi:20632_t:CDS:1 [Gigaspora rosea]|nr:20632_t:CDS:1 [Gigaspora rosea]